MDKVDFVPLAARGTKSTLFGSPYYLPHAVEPGHLAARHTSIGDMFDFRLELFWELSWPYWTG